MSASPTSEKPNSDRLFEDLQAVVRDAEALLQATAGQAGERLNDVRARAEKTIKQARARLQDAEDIALDRIKELASDTEDYVREKPWQSLGIAAGIGVVIGLLLGRRL